MGWKPGHRQAHGHAEDAGFRQRGVEDALRAVLGLQPVGDAEDAAEPAAVLAEDDGLGVLREDLVEGAVQRLLHRHHGG